MLQLMKSDMELKFYAKEKLKKQVLDIVARYLDIKKYKVFFFGSRVSGKGGERSDIDVGIEGPKAIPIEILAEIKEKIAQLPTLYSIDVVDFRTASKDFQKVAKKNIEIISS